MNDIIFGAARPPASRATQEDEPAPPGRGQRPLRHNLREPIGGSPRPHAHERHNGKRSDETDVYLFRSYAIVERLRRVVDARDGD